MWNKFCAIILIFGFVSLVEAFPQDSIATEITVADSAAHTITENAKRAYINPSNLSEFQRDSLINVIPKDTSLLTSFRSFEGNLAEKYASDSELDYERNVNKSFLQRLKEVISELLDKLLGRADAAKINNLSEIILNILLALIFLAAIYIVVRLFMRHRGRWFFEKKNEAVSVNLSNVEKHIHEANFATLLNEAEQTGDTRQSVRLLYLWVLKTFTDNEIIQWNPDKTNIDYLAEIQDKTLQEQFKYLSYLYNYIWYGEFSINDSEYLNARQTFLRHIKTKPENE